MNPSKTKIYAALILVALGSIASLASGKPIFAPAETLVQTLHSEQTDRDYELLILLPASYQPGSHQRYPTIYLTDAQWDFALVASICDKLAYDKCIPEAIIVGITYAGDDPDYGELRERDLTPSTVESVNPHSGDAPQFLRFLEETLIPHIEKTQPADPAHRVLGGTSYGGLFSLYTLYQKPDLFGRHIANSPAVNWDNGLIYQKQETFSQTLPSHPVRLSLTHGQEEEVAYRNAVNEFQLQLAAHAYANLELQQWATPQAGHASASITGWTRGLVWALADLNPNKN